VLGGLVNGLRPSGEQQRSPQRPVVRGLRISPEFWLDLTALVVAVGATQLSAAVAGPGGTSLIWVVVAVAVTLLSLSASGQYRPRFAVSLLDDTRTILGATAIAALSVAFLRLLFASDPHIATQAARYWLFASAYLIAARGGFKWFVSRSRRLHGAGEPTLIIGAGSVGQLVARRLLDRPEFGMRPILFVDDDPLPVADPVDLPIVGKEGKSLADRIAELVDERGVQHVIIAFSLESHEQQLELLKRWGELGVSVSLVPRLFEAVPDETTLERLGGIPLITVHPVDPRGWQFAVKYAIDRVAALVALIVLSPFMLFAAVGTLLTLGRPVFFRQRRVGIDGHAFDMLKFCTMRPASGPSDPRLEEALEKGLAPGGVEGEDRRTAFGKFLRATSLDELPQLINVLRGDMSLIGPRPERPEFAERFGKEVYRYRERHRVKSGITGWAQVHGLRGKTSIADRVEWDNYYIENWSLWLDFKIILLTILAVFRDRSE
jgi:exopolysaccharide biosynthesis polyprenyl glycosylphosphotransferase